ncbi:MAG: PD-(D/E)XK nuclease family protein, partial [Christensenellales bacterium]
MSGLTFLIGRANAGQTDALYRTAAAHAKRGERALVIVPEQATFAAERRLADIAGAGLIGVQVLSVERLSERILENSSRRLPYLSGEGVAMAVRRVAEIHGGTLSAFSRAVTRSGFCTELAELFSEMKRALIAPEQLRETAARLPDGTLLKEKLTDLSILYAATEAFFKERYLSPDDRMNAAIRLLPASFAVGAFLYFDGLPAMTRQFHALMDALLSAAAGVTVAETEDPSGADEALFAVAKSARTLLSTLAEE